MLVKYFPFIWIYCLWPYAILKGQGRFLIIAGRVLRDDREEEERLRIIYKQTSEGEEQVKYLDWITSLSFTEIHYNGKDNRVKMIYRKKRMGQKQKTKSKALENQGKKMAVLLCWVTLSHLLYTGWRIQWKFEFHSVLLNHESMLYIINLL